MGSFLVVIIQELVWEFIYAPIWWYTVGASRAIDRFYERLREGDEYFGWSVWLLNIFEPMYAQTDITGRLISIAVRIVEVIVRSIFLAGWVVLAMVLLFGYFLLPLITAAEIIYQWRMIIF